MRTIFLSTNFFFTMGGFLLLKTYVVSTVSDREGASRRTDGRMDMAFPTCTSSCPLRKESMLL
jgi:hypothetical protein